MSQAEYYLLLMLVLASPRMNEWVRGGMFGICLGACLWKTYGGLLG